MKKRARPSFSPDFKLEAVRLVVEGRRPLSQVARELDLRPEQLRGWKQQLQARGDVARPVSTLSLEEENRRLKRELEVARMERDFGKKSSGVLRERPARRFAMIAQHRDAYPLRLMCRVLAVTPSGFYAWQRRDPSARYQDDTLLGVQIAAFHRRSRRRYGSPRIWKDLREEAGRRVSRKRVARVMREAGLVGTPRRRFRVTTQADPRQAPAPNQLARQFTVSQPNRVWAADVTYLATAAGWCYLAVVLDLCSRQVVGWALSARLDRQLALTALGRALARRRPPWGLLHHSDRGKEYTSRDYQAQLAQAGIACSMSRRGDCWDNAVVESFFATLKRELVADACWPTLAEATTDLAQYLDGWYNVHRRHSTLGYLSPAAYEARLTAAA
ncbi:MAG: IS3 family transposase [Gemmatimonadetes bacterium]|nr:IS3 family transposase [Gemmatimonadota bacterium]